MQISISRKKMHRKKSACRNITEGSRGEGIEQNLELYDDLDIYKN